MVLVFFLCMWVFFLHVSLCTTRMPGDDGSQKRVVDPLDLEIQTVTSCHVGASSSGRAASALYL